ncbi:hypothetical protein GGS23DRAFT_561915 [Durotheca rogersii]|uniref:uncharacterized protein n=1 Tax=Durotheca rogersii TaxID=419775 RepID=UPI00222038A4|nr:uncharacterized protein GGS23DRAFT_561915 [Durotheca rogersii]KAI5864810.1 hypothetical protein GGS23DRAFT_561915 [Durotheca rogersii]
MPLPCLILLFSSLFPFCLFSYENFLFSLPFLRVMCIRSQGRAHSRIIRGMTFRKPDRDIREATAESSLDVWLASSLLVCLFSFPFLNLHSGLLNCCFPLSRTGVWFDRGDGLVTGVRLGIDGMIDYMCEKSPKTPTDSSLSVCVYVCLAHADRYVGTVQHGGIWPGVAPT